MATPELVKIGRQREPRLRRASAWTRLLDSERSEEIFPILLEEIIALGYPRAFVVAVDYETGDVGAVASLRCTPEYLERFRSTLYATVDPIVRLLLQQKTGVLAEPEQRKLYCQPAVFRSRNVCWEAERGHR
ncbi:MAG: hypothetical protein JOZ43_00315, partial [Acidobacteriales bacterium]|nr:hypothetical protein [Terriglobales bacterium]